MTNFPPKLELLSPDEPLMGQDKWLGGVSSWDSQYVYGVPGHAKRVLRVTVATGKVDLIGPSFPGPFKWLRGVETPQAAYCLPSNANSILRIDSTHKCTTIDLPKDVWGRWKWHGGCYIDGKIYAVPCDAKQVLVLDPETDEVTFMGDSFEGRHKWYGGIQAANGAMYCIPQCAKGVLKVVPKTGEVKIIGNLDLGGGWAFHGGTSACNGTVIIGIPSNADQVLKIDTRTDEVKLIGPKLSSGRHRIPQDGRYKYLGSALGIDGNVYMFPCDAERVLCINPETEEVREIGPRFLGTKSPTFLEESKADIQKDEEIFECLGENKWQNGFAAKDGNIYAIPQSAPGILCIIPNRKDPEKDAQVEVLPCGVTGKDKFEGAVLCGSDIYCIPLRAKHVVRLTPNCSTQKSQCTLL
eukprot:g4674.t1